MMDLPKTLTHRTPTGGWHVIYRLPEGHAGVPNSVAKPDGGVLGKGLDVRSTNGYIVAPGSTVEAGEYAVAEDRPIVDAPTWLVVRLGQVTAKAPAADVGDATEETVQRALKWLKKAERSVKGAGGDQTAYRVACQLRDFGLSYLQACEAMRSEEWDYGCGWRDSRLEDKPIASAYRYAQNEEGGTRAMATAGMFQTVGTSAQVPTERTKGGPQLADDLANEDIAGDPIVKHFLDRRSFAQIYGPSGEGKTFVALDIAYHVAAGKPWMGHKVDGGPVLYLAYEGNLRRRVKALRQRMGYVKAPLYIDSSAYDLRDVGGQQALSQSLAVIKQAQGQYPVLIIIDTFARAMMGGDENSAQDVGIFTQAVDELIRETTACVLIIHHSGKDASKGARGSSALRAALDTSFEVSNRTITADKQREEDMADALRFQLQPVNVGIDKDGEAITSCIVEADGSPVANSRPLSAKGEHAFSVVSDLTGKENAPVMRARVTAKLQDEGFGRSTSHEWIRRLEKAGRIMVENDTVRRRLQ